ncbi:MAG: hypothetical protein Q9192_006766, partial [Flavoplaca navasiana]
EFHGLLKATRPRELEMCVGVRGEIGWIESTFLWGQLLRRCGGCFLVLGRGDTVIDTFFDMPDLAEEGHAAVYILSGVAKVQSSLGLKVAGCLVHCQMGQDLGYVYDLLQPGDPTLSMSVINFAVLRNGSGVDPFVDLGIQEDLEKVASEPGCSLE